MVCQKCGTSNKDGAKFCTHCGMPLAGGSISNIQGQQVPSNGQNRPIQSNGQNQSMQPGGPQQNVPYQQPVMPTGAPQLMPQQPKKSKGPLIAIIVLLAVVIMAVAGILAYRLVVEPFLNRETVTTEVAEDETEEREETEETIQSEETEETAEDQTVAETDTRSLLTETLEADISSRGSLMNTQIDLITKVTWEHFSEQGVLGAVIVDLNGDGQEELVEVYLEIQEQVGMIYADIYAVEDASVEKIASSLLLNASVGYDELDANVYLKRNGSGYNLVGDSYDLYCHWADGGSWQFYAYDCTELSFNQISEFHIVGSAFEEELPLLHMEAATAAGLRVTQGLAKGPMLLQDTNLEMICNISNTVLQESFEYYFDNYAVLENRKYGIMHFNSYMSDTYALDMNQTADFIEEENARYVVSEAESYILPDSGTRLLTKADLSEIADLPELLKLARNEIYARHGRKFKDAGIQTYFDEKDWYAGFIEPDDFTEDMLSDLEKANRDLIVEVEKELQ